MALYLIVNQVDSCHDCVLGYLTQDTKHVLWMDDRVLIMTHKYWTQHEVLDDDCVAKMELSTLSIDNMQFQHAII